MYQSIYKIAMIPNLCLIFSNFRGHQVIINFVIFNEIKVAKYIWDQCCYLVSISPTFYEQLLRQNPFAKKLQTQIEST